MHLVLRGVNSEDGPDFVFVYIDDLRVFSATLEEHVEHLKKVLMRLQEAGLKLKPTKCHFLCEEVEHLGHVIIHEGLWPNPAQVTAVKDFPTPRSVKKVRQFMGWTLYYRRSVRCFAQIAEPLHALTRQNAVFN